METRAGSIQVSLRDPLRSGADDNELKEIIGAAVHTFSVLLAYSIENHYFKMA